MIECKTKTREIQLFQLPLATSALRFGELADALSPEEQARSIRFRNPTRRQALVVGRTAIRTILGAYCGLPPGEVRLTVDAHGKPRQDLVGQVPPCFNISHSPTLVVIGVTDLDGVGVDVEDLDRPVAIDTLLHGYFTPAERLEWANYSADDRTTAFFRGWTRKEAAWKFFGSEGLMHWKDIEVTFDANPHTWVRATTAPDGEVIILHCYSWHPTPNSVAAVVVQPAADELPQFAVQPIGFLTDE